MHFHGLCVRRFTEQQQWNGQRFDMRTRKMLCPSKFFRVWIQSVCGVENQREMPTSNAIDINTKRILLSVSRNRWHFVTTTLPHEVHTSHSIMMWETQKLNRIPINKWAHSQRFASRSIWYTSTKYNKLIIIFIIPGQWPFCETCWFIHFKCAISKCPVNY